MTNHDLVLTCPDLFLGARLEKLPLAPGERFARTSGFLIILIKCSGQQG